MSVTKPRSVLPDGGTISECHFGHVDIIIPSQPIPPRINIANIGEKATLSVSDGSATPESHS